MLSVKAFSAVPFLCLLAACGSASGTANNSSVAAPVTTNATAVVAVTDPTAFKLGVNLNTIDIYENSRPFMNLIYGSDWGMQNTNPSGGNEEVPAANLDSNGWVKSVPAGYQVRRGLSVPAAGGDIVCRYQGNGTLTVASGPVSNVSTAPGVTKFTVAPTNPADWKGVTLTYFVDPANYIRNIDCREATASTTDSIAPELLSALKGFKTVRFVKWSQVEANPASVTWATRSKPGDGTYGRNDGVPVEVMVDLANKAGVDPWVNIPWNADNDYITRYATYVRDNLAAGHQVYVEVSNEVWNGGYPVYNQATREAQAEGLVNAEDPTRIGGAGERYAERVQQVMSIWASVFSGQSNRLVRVFAWQHVSPYWSDTLLKYRDTYKYVDALATAPYFGHDAPTWTAGQSLDSIMNTLLPNLANEAVNYGVQQKTVAQKYGLRYVTYEAGQHILLPNNLALLQQIERDPRMANIYNSFISSWQTKIGDELTMFALSGPISQWGAWGMVEYVGQPVSQAPKMSAVQSFLGITTSSSTTTTTQVCSDGSVIPLTSTCPTSGSTATTQVCPDGSVIPLTSTCPTSGTTSGSTGGTKRRGKKTTAVV